MRYVEQRGEHDCGVACVAMVAGVSYERARIACNHAGAAGKRGLNTRELHAALQALGFDPPFSRLRKFGSNMLEPAGALIVKVPHSRGRNWHWIVRRPRGLFYDPSDRYSTEWIFATSYLARGNRR